MIHTYQRICSRSSRTPQLVILFEQIWLWNLRPLKGFAFTWQASVVIVSIWPHYRNDSNWDTFLLNNKNLFETSNLCLIQEEISLPNLVKWIVNVVASSRLSKSIKYSAVTLKRSSCWQFFLTPNSSIPFILPLLSSCSILPLATLLLTRDLCYWEQKKISLFSKKVSNCRDGFCNVVRHLELLPQPVGGTNKHF